MDISGALTALSGAISIAKELRTIDVDLQKAELKLKIIDLIDALIDAKSSFQDLADEARQKDNRIQELMNALKDRNEKFNDEGQFRYRKSPEGRSIGAPLCPICEEDGTYLQLHMIVGGRYACPKCKAPFGRGVTVYMNR